jgi:hypothetical protein
LSLRHHFILLLTPLACSFRLRSSRIN